MIDEALRQAIAEATGDDATHDDQTTVVRSVAVRCRDRGCRGAVARAAGSAVRFVSLEKSVERDALNEMTIVEGSVVADEMLELGHSPLAYCPRCWVRYRLDAVLQEVRTAKLLGQPRRAMPMTSW